jgi:ubiquinone/menaquinone biosynthesis C-methylase UbiE
VTDRDRQRNSVVRQLDDQRGSATKTQVRDYWDSQPLAVETVPYEVGTPESIAAMYQTWAGHIDEQRLRFLESCRGKKVLEVGCGTGRDARFLLENGIDYRGLDRSIHSLHLCRKMVAAANLPGQFVNGDADRLPFADGEFDLVFAIGVLHHVHDMQRACREVVRVAKPGATVRVMLYNRNSYHCWLVDYVIRPLIWLMIHVPGLSALAKFAPAKIREIYQISARHGFDRQRILNASTDTSHPGEGHFNPLSRFVTEREVRVLFDDLEDFEFFRLNLSYFPVPFLRRIVERYFGFFLTFTATKPRTDQIGVA